MKTGYNILILAAVVFQALLLQSCTDFLNTKPKDFVSPDDFYSNEKNLKAALTSVYSTLRSTYLYGSNYTNRMGADGELCYFRKEETANVALFKYNAANVDISNFWDRLYTGINSANYLLSYVDKAEVSDEQTRDEIRGEALFLRGYFYFLLVTNFGDVPLVVTPTVSLDSLKVPRTPSEEVYSRITEDMETAFYLVRKAEVTDNDPGCGGIVTKSAVAGILARVYLHWAGYPLLNTDKYADVKKWAQVVMTPEEVGVTHRLNPSFEEVFKNYAADKYDILESIWEVEFYGNNTDQYSLAGRNGDLNGIYSVKSSPMGSANGNLRATATLFHMYEDDDDDDSGYTDLRRVLAIAPFSYNKDGSKKYYTSDKTQIWGRYPGKYRREWEVVFPKTIYTPINYPLLRYSDVLLMYAEAENFLNDGPTQEAIDAVNLVRGRAEASLLEGSNVPATRQDFLEFLQDERARELCFEGLRRGDLIRWGIYVNAYKSMIATYRNASADSGLSESTRTFIVGLERIDNKHILWPIPTNERAVNKLLTQNEGW